MAKCSDCQSMRYEPPSMSNPYLEVWCSKDGFGLEPPYDDEIDCDDFEPSERGKVMDRRNFEADWQTTCITAGLSPTEMQWRHMLRYWMFQYTQLNAQLTETVEQLDVSHRWSFMAADKIENLESQLVQAKADKAGTLQYIEAWLADLNLVLRGMADNEEVVCDLFRSMECFYNENPHPGADLLRELEQLRRIIEINGICLDCGGIGERTLISGSTPESYEERNVTCETCGGSGGKEYDRMLQEFALHKKALELAAYDRVQAGGCPKDIECGDSIHPGCDGCWTDYYLAQAKEALTDDDRS